MPLTEKKQDCDNPSAILGCEGRLDELFSFRVIGKAMKKRAFIVGAGDFTDRGIYDPCDLLIAADGGLTPLKERGLKPDVIIGDFDSLGYTPQGGEDPEKNVADAGCAETSVGSACAETSGGSAYAGTSVGSAYAETSVGPGCADAAKEAYKPEIVTLPCEKDDTDMAAACGIAWERGCRDIRIYGGSGSRPDHFLANLQLAAHFSALGGQVCLVTPEFTVYALTGNVKSLEGDRTDAQSLEAEIAGSHNPEAAGSLTLHGEAGRTFSVFSHSDVSEGVSIERDVQYPLDNAVLFNTRTIGVSNCMTGETARISVNRGTLLVFLYTAGHGV